MSGGRVAGLVSIVLSILAAVAGILNLVSHHPRRELAAFIACGVLLVLGVILIAVGGKASAKAPTA